MERRSTPFSMRKPRGRAFATMSRAGMRGSASLTPRSAGKPDRDGLSSPDAKRDGLGGFFMTSQRRCIMIGAFIGLACGAVSTIAFRVASPTQGEIAVVIAGVIAGALGSKLAASAMLGQVTNALSSLAEERPLDSGPPPG